MLLIHGMSDKIIDVAHSFALKSNCGSDICKLVTPELMSHNEFRINEDIIDSINAFTSKNRIDFSKS